MSLLKVKRWYAGDWERQILTPDSPGKVECSERLESAEPGTWSCGNEGELDQDLTPSCGPAEVVDQSFKPHVSTLSDDLGIFGGVSSLPTWWLKRISPCSGSQ